VDFKTAVTSGKKSTDLQDPQEDLRTNGMSSGFREIRKWTLWRGRPPPKRKKKSFLSKSRICVITGHSRSYSPTVGRERGREVEKISKVWMTVRREREEKRRKLRRL
jgi:hypothetical protein